MEMDEIRNDNRIRNNHIDVEQGSPTEEGEALEGVEGEDGEIDKKETVVLRLGEGKITGPMRFITYYAAVFTFLVMIGFIVWLLMISPPFNVTPEILPEDMERHIPPHRRPSTTTIPPVTILPQETQQPEFSSDFNQA